jgi:hypothetical protein
MVVLLAANGGVLAQSREVTSAQASAVLAIPGMVGGAGAYGRIEDEREGFLGTTRWHQESVSGDMRLGQGWVGLSGNHTRSKKDLVEHTLTSGTDAGARVFGGSSRTVSKGIVLRGGGAIGAANLGGFVGYDTGETDESRAGGGVTAEWTRDVDTRSFGGYVSTLIDFGSGWYAMPTAQYLWSRTVSEATTDTLGQAVVEERDLLIRGLFGGEIGYQAFVGDLIATVGVRPYLVRDFHQFRNFSDDSAIDLSAFISLGSEQLSAGIEVARTAGRARLDSVSGRIFVLWRF